MGGGGSFLGQHEVLPCLQFLLQKRFLMFARGGKRDRNFGEIGVGRKGKAAKRAYRIGAQSLRSCGRDTSRDGAPLLLFPKQKKTPLPAGPPPPRPPPGLALLVRSVRGWGAGLGAQRPAPSLPGPTLGAPRVPGCPLGNSPSKAAASEAQQSRARSSMAPSLLGWIRSEFGGHQPPQV